MRHPSPLYTLPWGEVWQPGSSEITFLFYASIHSVIAIWAYLTQWGLLLKVLSRGSPLQSGAGWRTHSLLKCGHKNHLTLPQRARSQSLWFQCWSSAAYWPLLASGSSQLISAPGTATGLQGQPGGPWEEMGQGGRSLGERQSLKDPPLRLKLETIKEEVETITGTEFSDSTDCRSCTVFQL